MAKRAHPRIVFVDDSDDTYRALVENIAASLCRQTVTPLLGAGISFEPPSNLPMATALVAPLVDVLWDSTRFPFADISPTEDEVRAMQDVLKNARLERLLDVLHQTHGERALEYLSPLISEEWNANHAAIAALSQHGLLRHCITLNFDLLIERTSAAHGVSCVTLCPLAGKQFTTGSGDARLLLVKPHGSFSPGRGAAGPHEMLSATLSQVGNKPKRRNVDVFRSCIAQAPTLLVAGYSDNDWDIFPILDRLSDSIESVIWVEFATEEDVRRRIVPGRNVSETHPLHDRIIPWLRKVRGVSTLLIGRSKSLLRDLTEALGVAPLLPCPSSSQSSSPDASPFDASAGPGSKTALRTMVSFALLVQQTTRASERLLVWLKERTRPLRIPKLSATVEDAIGHTQHTYGNLEAALRHTNAAMKLMRSAGQQAEHAESTVWLGYEHLCMTKRPNPLKPIRLLCFPFHLLRGLYLLQKGVRMAAGGDREELNALAQFYRTDLVHSWGSLLLLLGPSGNYPRRLVFRTVKKMYERIAAASDLMDGEYYWLRHLEAELLSGKELDRNSIDLRLDEITRSYQLVQNNVQIGNTYAYRGLVAYLLGHGPEDIRRNEAVRCFDQAAGSWASASEGVSSGARRLCLFRRLIGQVDLLDAICELIKRS